MLKREMLKSMGLTDDQIQTIIDGHDETVSALKRQRDDYKARADQYDALKAERDKLQQQVDANNSGTDWKAEYDKLKADTEAKAKAEKVDAAFAQILKDEHIRDDLHDLIMRATDRKDWKLTRDDKLTDAENIAKEIREKYAAHIVKTEIKPTATKTPPGGSESTMTREQVWAKDDRGRYKLTAAQRQQALVEHPELMQPGTA